MALRLRTPGARALQPVTRYRASGQLGALLSSPVLGVRLMTALQVLQVQHSTAQYKSAHKMIFDRPQRNAGAPPPDRAAKQRRPHRPEVPKFSSALRAVRTNKIRSLQLSVGA